MFVLYAYWRGVLQLAVYFDSYKEMNDILGQIPVMPNAGEFLIYDGSN